MVTFSERVLRGSLDRRHFLGSFLALAATACTGGSPSFSTTPADGTDSNGTGTTAPDGSTTTSTRPSVEPLDPPAVELADDVFALGVASGDPDHRSVVLWTRLIGNVPDALQLLWEVAYDEDFDELAATGLTDVGSGFAHAAHVIVDDLPSDSRFFYRFRAGEVQSPIGRTRTLAAAGTTTERLRLAVSSCQLIETGYWAAHQDIADADIDVVLWLGDFIYGGGGFSQLEGRAHVGADPVGLGAYRDRYAQYRADPSLQAASAAHPWVATWDDHEVVNDYDASVDPARRLAAYQAWWEHQPTRLNAPGANGLDVYRSIQAGDLCRISVIDVRQHADGSTLLGIDQQQWLAGELDHEATWTILGSPVLVGGLVNPVDEQVLLPYTWDGYPAERAWLTDVLAVRPNRICVSGDLHAGAVVEVSADPNDLTLPTVATEFMAPAISSAFPADFAGLLPFIPLTNGHIDHVDAGNGWLMLDIEPTKVTAEFRTVGDVTNPAASVLAGPRYEVAAGDPTPRQL